MGCANNDKTSLFGNMGYQCSTKDATQLLLRLGLKKNSIEVSGNSLKNHPYNAVHNPHPTMRIYT